MNRVKITHVTVKIVSPEGYYFKTTTLQQQQPNHLIGINTSSWHGVPTAVCPECQKEAHCGRQ